MFHMTPDDGRRHRNTEARSLKNLHLKESLTALHCTKGRRCIGGFFERNLPSTHVESMGQWPRACHAIGVDEDVDDKM